MNLKNKSILITAGPTWVPIDDVRVISNIATGQTGIILAERLKSAGAKVTLMLGPIEAGCLGKGINVIRFRFFDELKHRITEELTKKKYDIVIHSAAVSDYRPLKAYRHKITSDKKAWSLTLVPTIKIIDLIRRLKSDLFLVGFKFEPQAPKSLLIKSAKRLMERAGLNLAVANTIHKNQYQAYILSQNKTFGPYCDKKDLAKKLIRILGTVPCAPPKAGQGDSPFLKK